MYRTELEALDVPFWTTTSDGNHVTRAEWRDIVTAEEHDDTYDAIVQAIKDDPRKSFSKRAILELIEGCMP